MTVDIDIEATSPTVDVDIDTSSTDVGLSTIDEAAFDASTSLVDIEIETTTVDLNLAGDPIIVLYATPGAPGPVDVSLNMVFGEVLSGPPDGVRTLFTTLGSFTPGATAVYRNGLREVRGVGYTESLPDTIVFTTAPDVGDDMTIDYLMEG